MRKYKNLFLLIIVVFLIASPLFLLPDAGFEGTDDLAGEAIEELNPSYTPWFDSLWEPGSEAAEKLIFLFQGAVGLSFIGYYFWTKSKGLKVR